MIKVVRLKRTRSFFYALEKENKQQDQPKWDVLGISLEGSFLHSQPLENTSSFQHRTDTRIARTMHVSG